MTSQQGLKQHKQEILLKSVKQQNSYFSQLHHSTGTLCNKFHAHWIHVFTMKNSTRIQHLFKINSKLLFAVRSLCNQYFSQVVYDKTRQDQQNWNHIFSMYQTQVMHFTRLKTFKKHLSSSILLSLKNTRNSAFHIFI